MRYNKSTTQYAYRVPGELVRVKREAGLNPAQQPLLCFVMRMQMSLSESLRRRSRRSIAPRNQPGDLPWMLERYFLGKWRRMALCFAGTVYLSPDWTASSELLRRCSFYFLGEMDMKHGGNVWEDGKPEMWMDFSANLRPEGTPTWVMQAMQDALFHYSSSPSSGKMGFWHSGQR